MYCAQMLKPLLIIIIFCKRRESDLIVCWIKLRKVPDANDEK